MTNIIVVQKYIVLIRRLWTLITNVMKANSLIDCITLLMGMVMYEIALASKDAALEAQTCILIEKAFIILSNIFNIPLCGGCVNSSCRTTHSYFYEQHTFYCIEGV